MADRELLEAAAKAAGWKGWRSKHGYWNIDSPDGKAHTCCSHWASYSATDGEKLPEPTFGDALAEVGWNPLEDDGDALRLASSLRINIEYTRTMGGSDAGLNCWPVGRGDCGVTESGSDAEDTRRAVVRAAAAMAAE